MKKLVVIIVALLMLTALGMAEDKAFDKDSRLLDASIGFSKYTMPFALGYEHALSDNLGLNFSALYLSWGYDFLDINQTLIMPQAHLNYHFKMKSPKWDFYAGGGVGFSIYSTDYSAEVAGGGVFISGIVGVRYYVSKKIAIHARETITVIGDWGGSYTLLGVTFKL